jgi:hypothetical protein
MTTDREPTFASVYDGRLAAFVEARLDEDTTANRTPVDGQHGCCCGRCTPALPVYLDRWCTARTAREIAGHRRILARFNRARQETHEMGPLMWAQFRADLAGGLRASALALADVACTWSDHPDFQAEWAHFCALDENAPTLKDFTDVVEGAVREVAALTGVPEWAFRDPMPLIHP